MPTLDAAGPPIQLSTTHWAGVVEYGVWAGWTHMLDPRGWIWGFGGIVLGHVLGLSGWTPVLDGSTHWTRVAVVDSSPPPPPPSPLD